MLTVYIVIEIINHVTIHNCFIIYTYPLCFFFFMGADLTYCTLLETMKELQGLTHLFPVTTLSPYSLGLYLTTG